ncbi:MULTISPECIES: VOC family protein [Pseudomonas syringae group]|uniref:Glyoxalase n=2 Tax=Pseudomonas syringae group TaxID=136849 RepID=A0A2K4WGF8_9PSED|nr:MULTISPECIES: VOC family protein [Pseudomonas syringae group]EGH12707.1 glyoxalase/bleomycin resistance protein/dioxygenase [Pseudomonas amygdali pv. morsprunorum str. M302280]KWS62289.1 glyoxalase [Pseudomonas amygdali pv. morsprunorum]PHN43971.1 glyoxalase [Pseudomonas avellanae]POC88106.1 glyoxalase [Pseudomonas avellanae]POD03451.1 glyoxalase [Pseudomonas avellanae]
MRISPLRLNHAVLYVADLERSIAFYTSVFDMTVVSREPRADAAFLRLARSGNDHDLGLMGVGAAADPKVRRTVGLYHLAWQLDTVDELVVARRALHHAGAYTGESSHGTTKSIYGKDPDGIEFELMWMLPRNQWAPFEGIAHLDRLDLDEEVQRWGQIPTAGRIVDTADEPSS